MAPTEASGSDVFDDSVAQQNTVRKVRIHKLRPATAPSAAGAPSDAARDAAIDRKIAELIPGLAELSVSESAQSGALKVASSVRKTQQAKDEVSRAQAAEMASIFDMSKPHPLDNAKPDPSKAWSQTLRPPAKRIVLSHYQAEMINYQRMHLRKNIWYYRDRLNNAR